MCEIRKRLPRSTWIIAIVHDEIIVETPEAKAEQVKKLLEEIMVSVFDRLFKKQVPIEVNAKIRENWGENEVVCDLYGSQIEVYLKKGWCPADHNPSRG